MDDLAAFDAEIARIASAVREADAAIVEGCQRGVELGVKAGEYEAKTTHKYTDRNGALTKSIQGRVERRTDRGADGVLEATADWASYVNDGTDPHAIEPRAKRLLAFEAGGERVFAKRVQHPGTAPDGFMDRGEAKAEEVINREIEAGVAKAARILGS